MTLAYFKQSRRCVEKQPSVQHRRSFLKQERTLAEGLAERKQTASVSAEMWREIGMYGARRKRIVEYGGKKSAAEQRFTMHPNAVSVTRC